MLSFNRLLKYNFTYAKLNDYRLSIRSWYMLVYPLHQTFLDVKKTYRSNKYCELIQKANNVTF